MERDPQSENFLHKLKFEMTLLAQEGSSIVLGFLSLAFPATTLGCDVILHAIWKLTRETKTRVIERL